MGKKKQKKDAIFSVIDLLDFHVDFSKANKTLQPENYESYWCEWIEKHYTSLPWRDDIIEHNVLICEVYRLINEMIIQKSSKKKIEMNLNDIDIDISELFNELGHSLNLWSDIEKARNKKIITLKGQIHLQLLLYLFYIENLLRCLLCLLIKAILLKKGNIEIRIDKDHRSEDEWKYEDSSMSIPIRTVMILKKKYDIKEITSVEQISELNIRELKNIFRHIGYPIITDEIDNFCNFNLRNNIAHGKFSINSRKKVINFSDETIITFKELDNEDHKIFVLSKLIIIGIRIGVRFA